MATGKYLLSVATLGGLGKSCWGCLAPASKPGLGGRGLKERVIIS